MYCYFFKQQALCSMNNKKKNTGIEEGNKNVNQIARHFLSLKICKSIEDPTE